MSAASAAGTTPARIAIGTVLLAAVLLVLGASAGSEGLSFDWAADSGLIQAVRLPRSTGALLTGMLLGLAGAIAQGLFRNPLADPYLLGSAAGAGLGVVLVLAAPGVLGGWMGAAAAGWLLRLGLVGAAFAGALLGVLLTLVLARGSGRPLVLLLSGVVVGIVLSAIGELVTLFEPEALRGRQVFLLGSTAFVGWPAVAVLGASLALVLPLAAALARALDAWVLGEAGAASLGVPVARVRLVLVLALALATGCAVAQAGLVAFVGLVAPHVMRRLVVCNHRVLLVLSALGGGVLLLAADLVARLIVAPQELPVGLLTAVLGGGFLLVQLRRRGAR